MKTKTFLLVSMVAFFLFFHTWALKVQSAQTAELVDSIKKEAITSVENHHYKSECSKQFCMQKYGLLPDPFDPHCDENATCWQEWYGFPHCRDDDIKCWKVAVGYPKDCDENDFECWMKSFHFSLCEDTQCLKDYLNMSCKSNDLECWKTKTWLPKCEWNDWNCWVQDRQMEWVCGNKQGYDCVSQYYSASCKQDDQNCWRKTFGLPTQECEKDIKCFKQFYYLPTCEDDDFQCWKKHYYGPDCQKGDMDCLKQYLFIPNPKSQKDEVQYYKKWLQYPDCKIDDGKCWKDWNDAQNTFSGGVFWTITFTHHKAQSYKPVSFGQMMQHRRNALSQVHKLNRQFHMKRAESMY